MWKALHACILAIITYGAPAWWPGRLRMMVKGEPYRTAWKATTEIRKSTNYRTVCNSSCSENHLNGNTSEEAATPPIYHALDYPCELAALRMHKLEPQHPLRIITRSAYSSTSLSRIERLGQKCPKEVEYLDPLLGLQPWEGHLFGGSDREDRIDV